MLQLGQRTSVATENASQEKDAGPEKDAAGPEKNAAGPEKNAGPEKDASPEKNASTEAQNAETPAATNNNSNVNRNINCSNDADSGSRCFMSAWSEVWKDLQTVLRAAPDLCTTVKLEDDELMKFPDEIVDALAQSLVRDVYMAVSEGQSDPETVEDHLNRLVISLTSALDLDVQQSHHYNYCTVRMMTTISDRKIYV